MDRAEDMESILRYLGVPKNPPRKHHYLSRCYLEGFCDPDMAKPWLYWRMPKDTAWRGTSPEAVAYQTDLNTFEDEEGKKRYEVEQLFSRAETHVGPILKGLSPERPLTPPERRWIAMFTGLTKARVPVARGFVQKELDKEAGAFAPAALDAFRRDPTAFPGVTQEQAEHLKAANADDFD